MIIASEARARARQTLTGNWKKAVVIMLLFILINFGLGMLEAIPLVGSILGLLVSIPLAYGLLSSFIKLKRNETLSYTTFLDDGFSKFKQAWFVSLHVALKLLPWLLLLILSVFLLSGGMVAGTLSDSGFAMLISLLGIILYIVSFVLLFTKSLYYSLAQYILFDNPDMPAKEIVEKSKTLMTGNRARIFCLNLSFIGWMILSIFTLGIGYLFLAPYMQISLVHFYDDLIEEK